MGRYVVRQQKLEEGLKRVIDALDKGRERITDPSPAIQNRQRGELLRAVRKIAEEALK